ncbi:hypothetical protein K1W54_28390, partial [Micromonospora sp. CPCC 205371]|nr:hypothetical protein [Micromonospora sp. CPCC 205371]
MHLPTVFQFVAIASALFGVLCTGLLAFAARRHVGVARRGHRLLAAGAGVTLLTVVGGIVASRAVEEHLVHTQPGRTSLGNLLATGVALGSVLLLLGLLAMPGGAPDRSRALRYLLDALVIAAALWFVGCVLLSTPTKLLGDRTPYWCRPLLLPAAVAALALGLSVMAAMRARRPRGPLVGVGIGVTAVTIAGSALAGGVCQGWTEASWVALIAMPAGLGLIAVASRRAERPPRQSWVGVGHAAHRDARHIPRGAGDA